MWWAGSKAHDVYLGTRAFAVCQGSERLQVQAVEGFEGAIAALGEWLKTLRGRPRLRIWLSGGICRPFILPQLPGIKSRVELLRATSALAPQRTGLSGECRVWVDRNSAHMAAAVQQGRLDELFEATGSAQIKSIRPWWAELLRVVLQNEPQVPVIAAHDCDSLTLLAGRDGRFDIANTLSPVRDRETADAALARMLLSVESEAGQELIGRLTPLDKSPGVFSRPEIAMSPCVEFSR